MNKTKRIQLFILGLGLWVVAICFHHAGFNGMALVTLTIGQVPTFFLTREICRQ